MKRRTRRGHSPDRVLIITRRKGRPWIIPLAPPHTGTQRIEAMGYKVLYKVNVYPKEMSA